MSRSARGEVFDVAIVGGGLVGSSLACALAPLGYRIAVLEAAPFREPGQPSYDDRTLALNHGSGRILEQLGIWQHLGEDKTAIREIIVTELGRPGRVVLSPAELHLGYFGHIVEARMFGHAVLTALKALDNVELACPATVTAMAREGEGVRLTLTSDNAPAELCARLVVAADGAASAVRRLAGIEVSTRDYGQTAVICNITPEQAHRGRAFERLTPTGPLAVLPHVGDRCGLVWSVASTDADRLLQMPEDAFLAEARRRFGGELGDFEKMGARSSYPLKLVRAERDVDERLVVLGNAAHAIHPIGAQGFNLGLRDVAVLAEALAAFGTEDPGNLRALAKYSAWRRPDHERTISWSDGLARLFANPSPLAGFIRSAGLVAHALAPSLRKRLAIGAMGYEGRVPRLAQGLPLQIGR